MRTEEERYKEELLDELYEVRECVEMTTGKMRDQNTRLDILRALYRRIAQLEVEVDAKIDAEELGGDMAMEMN